MSRIWLSPLLNEIADIAGTDAALALAKAHGGARVSIPARATSSHWLVELLGREAADKICNHYRIGQGRGTGVSLDIPTGPEGRLNKLQAQNREDMDHLIADGVSADEIARRLGVHRTTVFRRKAKTGPIPKNIEAPKFKFPKKGNP